MEEEEDDNDGEVAVEGLNDEEDELMEEDEFITRVPGQGGVPILPGGPQATKLNGITRPNKTS